MRGSEPNANQCAIRFPDDQWVMVAPVISTGHFPKVDCDRLYSVARFIEQADPELSCILHRHDLESPELWGELSESTREILTHFMNRGLWWIRIDPDGDTLPGFKTFNWEVGQ